MDFSRFNQAEQAQIAAMIEHKQVRQTISDFNGKFLLIV
jgi:hypothetical protein